MIELGWAAFGEDGTMNTGTVVTLGALGALGFLVFIIIIGFFSHRRIMSDESQSRKVSRSSTNQLIANVANGLAAHIDGPDPGPGGSAIGTPTMMAAAATSSSPCSPFHNCYADVQSECNPSSHMTSFGRPRGGGGGGSSAAANQHSNNNNNNINNNGDCGRRIAGDGGSVVEEPNYATVKNLTDEDLELMEEESHYALVRKPDGRADEPTYSSLR